MTTPKKQHSLTPGTLVVTRDDVLSCDLSGEEAMLDLDSGTYYGLNESGAIVWRLMREPTRVSDLVDQMVEQYEVDRAHCERDVLSLVGALIERGLARVVD